jgi:hypothetical protein
VHVHGHGLRLAEWKSHGYSTFEGKWRDEFYSMNGRVV